MLQRISRASGLIEPCLPSPAKAPPVGSEWIHEIKHDGFRIMTRRDAKGVRLYTRNGNDFTKRFPLVVASVMALPVRSCLIDGEVVVTDEAGLAVFELIRSFRHDHAAVLCAFDLLEIDGRDTRRLPIELRKAGLAQLLHKPLPGIAFNEHHVGNGDIVFAQACKLGCEGIVSKRLGSLYRSGRSKQWVKVKNPAAPTCGVRRRRSGVFLTRDKQCTKQRRGSCAAIAVATSKSAAAKRRPQENASPSLRV
jgi:ATP-dependent DNA ligase